MSNITNFNTMHVLVYALEALWQACACAAKMLTMMKRIHASAT
jgi:hypothetical protein